MKKITISMLFCLSALQIFAGGGTVTLEIADDFFNRLAFSKAADYYIKYLENNDDVAVWYKLAECYEMTNDYESLLGVLKSIAERPDITDDNVYLKYAEVLQISGNYPEAANYYKKYVETNPDDQRGINQLRVCETYQLNKNRNREFSIISMEFNTKAFEYAPNVYKRKLYYTSTSETDNTSEKVHLWTGGAFSDIKTYQVKGEVFDFEMLNVERVNTPYNDGPFIIDPITNEFYYTRNNYNEEKIFNKKGINYFNYMNLKIYVAAGELKEDSRIKEFEYNAIDYNTGHPAISPDGKYLIFVCDNPLNNIGGRDLYYCIRSDSGSWQAPILLTEGLNTEGDELFPYFHKDGTVYFASNGLGSLGGLDIFKAKINFESNTFSNLERLNEGINSTYDDFGIVFENDREGYFTSDRIGGAGKDDIYYFKDNTLLLNVIVVNALNDSILPGSSLQISEGNNIIFDGITDKKASYQTRILSNKTYNLVADEENFLENSEQAISKNLPLTVKIRLTPIEYKVQVLDAVSKAPISGAIVDVNYICKSMQDQLLTKFNGVIDLKVYKNCNYQFKAKADGYLANRLEWSSSKEDKNETIIIYLEKVAFDAPIVLRNIYYDFDKANLRLDESSEDLEKLYTFLTDNPELTIQINSHTDSRGSFAYNENLSQRRAQSVVNYLVDRKIQGKRLKAAGFGERLLVNGCSDKVKCTEVEHQLNRRTEFQVINADGSTKIKSDSRTDIVIDPCVGCPF